MSFRSVLRGAYYMTIDLWAKPADPAAPVTYYETGLRTVEEAEEVLAPSRDVIPAASGAWDNNWRGHPMFPQPEGVEYPELDGDIAQLHELKDRVLDAVQTCSDPVLLNRYLESLYPSGQPTDQQEV